jgi:hypothetical protein
MALKTSHRWQAKEREIKLFLSQVSDPQEKVCISRKQMLSAEDVVEEVRRGTELGEKAMHVLLP